MLHMRASGARRTRHASAADGRSSRSGAPWPRAAAPCGMRTAGGGRTRRTAARAVAARTEIGEGVKGVWAPSDKPYPIYMMLDEFAAVRS